MTSVDDARKGPTRESGKRLYVSPTDYQAQMRRGTIKGYDAGAAPWSEFEKPYWEDSYEEMEYFMWNWPGFAPWRWDFSFDNPSLPTTQESGLGAGFLVFECQVYGGFCPGETRCVGVDCSHPLTGVALANSWAEREFSLSLESPTSLCITAVEDSAGGVEVDFFMRSVGGVAGAQEDVLIGTASDCEDCDTAEPMEDSGDNPTLVSDSTNYEITVINGVGPFSWSVSAPQSPDVSMQRAVTSNRSNYLLVANGCGSIVITVIDSCATVVQIGLRSTDGSWRSNCQSIGRGGSGCACGGAGFDIEGPDYYTSSGDEFEVIFNSILWRFRRTLSNDCDDLGFPSCCKDNSPDCSAVSNCYPNESTGWTCDGFSGPCVNDCGSKGSTPVCGTTVRTGDNIAVDYWQCT